MPCSGILLERSNRVRIGRLLSREGMHARTWLEQKKRREEAIEEAVEITNLALREVHALLSGWLVDSSGGFSVAKVPRWLG